MQMTQKTEYLRNAVARLQRKKTVLAKFTAHVRTRGAASPADNERIEKLNLTVRKIQKSLDELVCARQDEWTSIQARLDEDFDAIEVPLLADADVSPRPADNG
jgi:hypothetical protein